VTKKKYHWYVWQCSASSETRGRTNTQARAQPCGCWSIHKSRDTLDEKPRAKCNRDHGDGKTRRQYLTEKNVDPLNRFDNRWDAIAKWNRLEALREAQEGLQ